MIFGKWVHIAAYLLSYSYSVTNEIAAKYLNIWIRIWTFELEFHIWIQIEYLNSTK